MTASAASSPKPPRNTEHCASAACSHGTSRSHDQSSAPRSVLWRAVSSREAEASSSKRSDSRSSIDVGVRRPIRAAAKLDGEGHTVEPRDEVPDRSRIGLVGHVLRPDPPRAIHEELHRLGLVGRGAARGDLERLEPVDAFDRDLEPFARRRQEPNLWGERAPPADSIGDGAGDLLAVVEDDQHGASLRHALAEQGHRVGPAAGQDGYVEPTADGENEPVLVARRRQVAEPDASSRKRRARAEQ